MSQPKGHEHERANSSTGLPCHVEVWAGKRCHPLLLVYGRWESRPLERGSGSWSCPAPAAALRSGGPAQHLSPMAVRALLAKVQLNLPYSPESEKSGPAPLLCHMWCERGKDALPLSHWLLQQLRELVLALTSSSLWESEP